MIDERGRRSRRQCHRQRDRPTNCGHRAPAGEIAFESQASTGASASVWGIGWGPPDATEAKVPGSPAEQGLTAWMNPRVRRASSSWSPVKMPSSSSIPALVRRISTVSRGVGVEDAFHVPCSTTSVRTGARNGPSRRWWYVWNCALPLAWSSLGEFPLGLIDPAGGHHRHQTPIAPRPSATALATEAARWVVLPMIAHAGSRPWRMVVRVPFAIARSAMMSSTDGVF